MSRMRTFSVGAALYHAADGGSLSTSAKYQLAHVDSASTLELPRGLGNSAHAAFLMASPGLAHANEDGEAKFAGNVKFVFLVG